MNMPEHNAYPLKWIRAQQYCKLTGVADSTFHAWKNGGLLIEGRHYKQINGRTYFINVIELDRWIENQNM